MIVFDQSQYWKCIRGGGGLKPNNAYKSLHLHIHYSVVWSVIMNLHDLMHNSTLHWISASLMCTPHSSKSWFWANGPMSGGWGGCRWSEVQTLGISYDVFFIQHVLSQYDSWAVFVFTINTHCFTVHWFVSRWWNVACINWSHWNEYYMMAWPAGHTSLNTREIRVLPLDSLVYHVPELQFASIFQ